MKLPIKTKRDWIIAFLILFVALYYSTMYFEMDIEEFMIRFAPDKLNVMNYPAGWGNFLVVGFLMTILLIAMMVITKIRTKRIVILAVGGTVFTIAMFVGFIIHTKLIVGTSMTMEATSIRINCYDKNVNVEVDPESDLATQFMNAAVTMKAKSVNEQKILRADKESIGNGTYHVWISYPKKYGQSYDLILYIEDDEIYSYHGMGTPDTRIFYEDNGLCELMQRLVEESASN